MGTPTHPMVVPQATRTHPTVVTQATPTHPHGRCWEDLCISPDLPVGSHLPACLLPQAMCGVLVFDPESAHPLRGCLVPGTPSATLLYVGPGMPQHSRLSEASPPGCSPLLVLREDRTYGYALEPGRAGGGRGGCSPLLVLRVDRTYG